MWLGWGDNEGKIEIYNNETNELLLSKTVEGRNKWILLDIGSVDTKSIRVVKYDCKPIYEISFYGN